MNRIISTLLALALCVSLFSVGAGAETSSPETSALLEDYVVWFQEEHPSSFAQTLTPDSAIVVEPYGSYGSGDVMLIYPDELPLADCIGYEKIGPYVFEIGNCNLADFFLLYHDHTFTTVMEAYDLGLLSRSELDTLAQTCGAVHDPLTGFTDLPDEDHWSYEGICYAVDMGYMNGTGDTTFEPEKICTRAEVVTVLFRDMGLEAKGSVSPFNDVAEGQWYTDAVIWASENNIVTGHGDGTFAPNDPVTREQLAAILYRIGKWLEIDPMEYADLTSFADYGQISDWAVEPMGWCHQEGYINGRSAVTIDPAGIATRAEIATILMRFFG